jgi:hypothetical protein
MQSLEVSQSGLQTLAHVAFTVPVQKKSLLFTDFCSLSTPQQLLGSGDGILLVFQYPS